MPVKEELSDTGSTKTVVQQLTSFPNLNWPLTFFFPEDSWTQISTRNCFEVKASLRNPVACVWFMLTDGSVLLFAPRFLMTELVWKT